MHCGIFTPPQQTTDVNGGTTGWSETRPIKQVERINHDPVFVFCLGCSTINYCAQQALTCRALPSCDPLTREIDLPVVGCECVRRVDQRTEAMRKDEPS